MIPIIYALLESFGARSSFVFVANVEKLISSVHQKVLCFCVFALVKENSAQGMCALRFTQMIFDLEELCSGVHKDGSGFRVLTLPSEVVS